MQIPEGRVAVYYAMPLCTKCDNEVSMIRRASEQAGSPARISFSPWNRIRYGLQLLRMPVVVVDNKVFSVLGAFRAEALISELKRDEENSRMEAHV